MKKIFPWLILLVVLLGLGWPLDHGETRLGIPVFVWLAVNLTLFLWVLARYVGRPMGAFLDARREEIGEKLIEAREKLAEAEKLNAEIQQRLESIDGEVAALMEKAEKQAEVEAERIEQQAREEEERFLRRIEAEISRREEETRQQLIQESAALTAELARKIIEDEITQADRKRVLNRQLEALGDVGEK